MTANRAAAACDGARQSSCCCKQLATQKRLVVSDSRVLERKWKKVVVGANTKANTPVVIH